MIKLICKECNGEKGMKIRELTVVEDDWPRADMVSFPAQSAIKKAQSLRIG
jgi:hypothetical protein